MKSALSWFVLVGSFLAALFILERVDPPVIVHAQRCPQGFTLTGGVCVANGTSSGGATGPPGSIGALVKKGTSYAVTCPDIAANTAFQATAALTFTLPTGCTSGWVSFVPASAACPVAFNLSTNSVTVNSQSTLTSLTVCTGTAGFPGYVLTPDSTTDFSLRNTGPQGVAGANGGSGPALGAVMTIGSGQSLTGGTGTNISFSGGTLSHDTGSFGSLTAGTFTVPAGLGGWYSVSAMVMFSASPTAPVQLDIYQNGATNNWAVICNPQGTSPGCVTGGPVYLSAGDSIVLNVYVQSTATVASAAFALKQ